MKNELVKNSDQKPNGKSVSVEFLEKWIKQSHEINLQVLRGIKEPGKGLTLDDLQILIEHKYRQLQVPTHAKSNPDAWMDRIVKSEQRYLDNFYGFEVDLAPFVAKLKEYGREKIVWWKRNLFEVHYLPPYVYGQGVKIPGLKIAIPDHYYEWLAAGKAMIDVDGSLMSRREAQTDGITVLIDTRLKPAYDGGRQMWKRDGLIGGAIQKCRIEKKIANYDPQNSRFGTSADNELDILVPVVAEALKLEPWKLRLETTIERIVIPQIYLHMPRKDDGKTNTSVWCEEFFGSRRGRVYGGDSGLGGLAGLDAYDSGRRWVDRSLRFLAVL